MNREKNMIKATTLLLCLIPLLAYAQSSPRPVEPSDPHTAPPPKDPTPSDPKAGDPFTNEPGTEERSGSESEPGAEERSASKDEPARSPHPPRKEISMPQTAILRAPTARLLPAGTIRGRASVDTGGGIATSVGVGLGDVANFYLETTDLVRRRLNEESDSKAIKPYLAATFTVGLKERRLFYHQPALALVFRKSFKRDYGLHKTQFAQLSLVASKRIGRSLHFHVGASAWDASIAKDTSNEQWEVFHHDRGIQKLIKPFGGLEIAALPKSDILIEFDWTPEYVYEARRVDFNAMLAWGVR